MKALALLEYESVAAGVLAVDRLLKRAPVALLRCGTVHPGRYLVLCGGSVASTEEAWRAATTAREPADAVLLPDPHPALRDALTAGPPPATEADLLVLETPSSPLLLKLLDLVLKRLPLGLPVLRLADDLGGHALALLEGELADLQDAGDLIGAEAPAAWTTVIARPDPELRATLAETTRFSACPLRELAAGELVREV